MSHFLCCGLDGPLLDPHESKPSYLDPIYLRGGRVVVVISVTVERISYSNAFYF